MESVFVSLILVAMVSTLVTRPGIAASLRGMSTYLASAITGVLGTKK